VHYFNSKFLKGGPFDGSMPQTIEEPVKSHNLGLLKMTRDIEEVLSALEFEEAEGSLKVTDCNR